MQHSRELRGLMLAVYHEWSQGDRSFLDVLSMDDDAILIGTDPAEWMHGGRAVRAVFETQLDEGLADLEIVPGVVHAFASGETGWVIDDPLFRFAHGPAIHMRSTVVFQRDEGAWRIVHWHISIGAPNAEALGIELTTSLEVLLGAVEAAPPDLEPFAADDGSVTIAFTDIESSTEMNERLGDEAWYEILRWQDGLVRSAVAEVGGTTVKNQGDGYMLAFPTPEPAVRCLLAIHAALEHQPAERPPIRVRAGLHSGRPIEEAGDFFGRDVAYAARVAASANGGEIVASDRVRASLERSSVCAFHPPRAVRFKGFEGDQLVSPVVART